MAHPQLSTIIAREEEPGCFEIVRAPACARLERALLDRREIDLDNGMVTITAMNGTFHYRIDIETAEGNLICWLEEYRAS